MTTPVRELNEATPVNEIDPGFCQLARPEASLVRTLPAQGEPQVILICPFTSSFAPGVEVPIPILLPDS